MLIHAQVEHSFRDFTLSVMFDAPASGVTVLFGPSGSGKSTVLNALAGLFRPDRVRIDFGGAAVHRIAAHRRRFGTVFQEGRLFPHLTVRDNLLFGARRAPRRLPRRIGEEEVVSLLGLSGLLGRRPGTLSGGERQRVAIGRALLSQPVLLLMDEPLASLDGARRAEILPYLSRLRDTLRLPVIYVTHAMEEVVRLADHLVLLEHGHVVAQGGVSELATRVDLPLAARDDAAGVLDGYVHEHDEARRLTAIACGGQVIMIPLQDRLARQQPVRLRIAAREVIVALDVPRAISVTNIMPAIVVALGRDEDGRAALVEMDVGGGTLIARITPDAVERLRLRPGARALAMVKSTSVELVR